MQWKEKPRDWIWDGDPDRINAEIRAHMGRRRLSQEEVATIIGIKRQALARRLKSETDPDRTPWRWSELIKLAWAWDIYLYDLTGAESPEIRTHTPADTYSDEEPPHEVRSCGCQVNAPHLCGRYG